MSPSKSYGAPVAEPLESPTCISSDLHLVDSSPTWVENFHMIMWSHCPHSDIQSC